MTRLIPCLLVLLGLLHPSGSRAHELRPGYLELRETAPEVYEVLWKVPARGESERLSLQVRFADDVNILTEPVDAFLGDAHVQRMRIGREGGLAGTEVAIDGLTTTYTDVLLRMEHADGTILTRRLTPEAPVYVIETRPGKGQVAWTYFVLGIEHILLGIDHLLFVLALLLVVTGWRKLVATITAFTVAHSITLALATLGFVHMPGPPVEAAIALSIVFVAAEVIHGRQGHPGLTARWPWVVAFTFGLLHGFGFAGALSNVGLPQTAIPIALLFFNLGVEAGQLLFVAMVLGVVTIARRVPISLPRWVPILPPYAIGGIAAFWLIERVAGF